MMMKYLYLCLYVDDVLLMVFWMMNWIVCCLDLMPCLNYQIFRWLNSPLSCWVVRVIEKNLVDNVVNCLWTLIKQRLLSRNTLVFLFFFYSLFSPLFGLFCFIFPRAAERKIKGQKKFGNFRDNGRRRAITFPATFAWFSFVLLVIQKNFLICNSKIHVNLNSWHHFCQLLSYNFSENLSFSFYWYLLK